MSRSIPEDRIYSGEHEWLKLEGTKASMGISDHAQCALGDVVYVELPDIGQSVTRGKAVGVVESVKAVSDIYAPMSGKIIAVNHKVIEKPELINQDPYGEGWLLMIEVSDISEKNRLLDKNAYEEMLKQEAK